MIVERTIRYVRDNFFAARPLTSLERLNQEARFWLENTALERWWPDDDKRKIAEVFALEKTKLRPLPGDDFPAYDRHPVRIGKSPWVRFDLSDYSVPPKHVMPCGGRACLSAGACHQAVAVQVLTAAEGYGAQPVRTGIREACDLRSVPLQTLRSRQPRLAEQMLDALDHLALHERGEPGRQPQQQPVHGAGGVAAGAGVDGVYHLSRDVFDRQTGDAAELGARAQFGPGMRRNEHGDVDAEASQLAPQRAGERFERCLARCVVGSGGRRTATEQ